MMQIIKYPRTQHLEGSCLQVDDDRIRVQLKALPEGLLVWEEKLDGANCGISFSENGELLLQSRGHILSGGARERQFDILKSWAQVMSAELRAILGTRYIMYGEWLYAKHSVFYDELPHYFFEFDIYDKDSGVFLSTFRRHEMLSGSPVISVPVVKTGRVKNVSEIEKAIGPSLYISDKHEEVLRQEAVKLGLEPEQVMRETDMTGLSEGFYFKLEDDEKVLGRYKFVRSEFLQTILESGSHWNERPIIPNRLA
ncbi:MAG: RNA ligase family protein, partial [Methyloligellaceae bacterium]